jgi:hypothetical protein
MQSLLLFWIIVLSIGGIWAASSWVRDWLLAAIQPVPADWFAPGTALARYAVDPQARCAVTAHPGRNRSNHHPSCQPATYRDRDTGYGVALVPDIEPQDWPVQGRRLGAHHYDTVA